MLVLTRRITPLHRDTDIFITAPSGDVIKVTLVQIKGKQIRLGFSAPDGYEVDRAEVYHENKLKREEAQLQLLDNSGNAVIT